MSNRKFLKIVFGFLSFIILFVVGVNYIVDPYNLYGTSFYQNKPKMYENMRLIKSLLVEKIKPESIVLGTSRAEIAIDSEHEYFIKPSYNLANAGSTMYETKFYLKKAINQGNLKKVLLIADWRMFNDTNMKKVPDFETYFNNINMYSYLLNYKVLQDSFFTIKNQEIKSVYKNNGQMKEEYLINSISSKGGHYKTMIKKEKNYYKELSNDNLYKDTKKDSFIDFKEILEMCYDNNIELDIVFGPSHIRQWEAFDYYKGYENLLKWKKDIVLFVEKIAFEENKIPFRVMDFAVYHEFTSEVIPKNPDERMKFHFEGSHYTNKLGLIVLDRLIDKSPYSDFGVVINSSNIDIHLENLRNDRIKFINTKEYRKEVFKKEKINKKSN